MRFRLHQICAAEHSNKHLVQLPLHSQPAIFLRNAGLHCLVSGQPNNIFLTSTPKHNERIFTSPYLLIYLGSHTADNSYSIPFLSCPLLPSIYDFLLRLQFMYRYTGAPFPTDFHHVCLSVLFAPSLYHFTHYSLFS